MHIAGKWQFEHLSKYTKNTINTARDAVDTEQFNPNIKPIGRKKTKFTFFSPLRLDKSKGSDLLWEALKLCKSDFEILGVDWFEEQLKGQKNSRRNSLRKCLSK